MSGKNTGAYPLNPTNQTDADFAPVVGELTVLYANYVILLGIIEALLVSVEAVNAEAVTLQSTTTGINVFTDYQYTGIKAYTIFDTSRSIQTQVEYKIWDTIGWSQNLSNPALPTLLLGYYIGLEAIVNLAEIIVSVNVDDITVSTQTYFLDKNITSVQAQVPITCTSSQRIDVLIQLPLPLDTVVLLLPKTNLWICNFFPTFPIPDINTYPV